MTLLDHAQQLSETRKAAIQSTRNRIWSAASSGQIGMASEYLTTKLEFRIKLGSLWKIRLHRPKAVIQNCQQCSNCALIDC